MNTKLASLLIRITGVILSTGQTVLLARLMGPENLGEYAAVLAITAVLVVPAAAGLPAFLTREVARTRMAGDSSGSRGLIIAANRAAAIVSAVAMLTVFLLLYFRVIGDLPLETILVSCLIVPILSSDLVRAGAMRGLGSALASQLPESILRPGFFLVAVSLLASLGVEITTREALLAFAVAGIGSTLTGQLLLWRILRHFPKDARTVSLGAVIRGTSGIAFFGGTQTLIAQQDILILSVAGFFVAAGVYKVALLGVVGLIFVFGALAVVAGRDFAAALATRDFKSVTSISDKLVLQGTISTIAIGLIYLLFGRAGIDLIFGPEYSGAYSVLLLLTTGHVIALACGPSQEIVTLLDSFTVPVAIYASGVAVAVGVSIALFSWNPALAVATGSAVSNVLRRLLLGVYLRQRYGLAVDVVSALRRSRH